MTVKAQDKPISQLRQEVIDQLVLNYGHEKISKAAFERRLDEAYDADDHNTLLALTSDLESFVDPAFNARRDHMLYADKTRAEKSGWIINIFSATQRNFEDIVPASIKMINIFGGVEIDYSLALYSSPDTHIKVINIFGGAEIFVAEGVRVKTKVIPLFGGTSNKSEPNSSPDSPIIHVSGLNLFGGVDIGVKRTFRERMQSFADDIKQMLS